MVHPKRIGARAVLTGLLVTVLFPACTARPAVAQEPAPPEQELQRVLPKKPPYSPYVGRNFRLTPSARRS
jgi:hypothetical protein